MGKNHGDHYSKQNRWALILGGSKGLGLATAEKLASHGYQLFIVHRDRKLDLPDIEQAFKRIRSTGVQCHTFNCDALREEKLEDVLRSISKHLGGESKIHVMVHSIARGNVKPMGTGEASLSHAEVSATIHAMAVSFYQWGRALLQAGLLSSDSRFIAFTSEGSSRALPAYGAVGAAKAALESLCRNMAVEWAPRGVRVNCIQAGVTETESFGRIPGSEKIRDFSLKRNPSGRLTRPSDVADAVYLLTLDEAAWITGTVIKADGGESLR